MTLTQTGSRLTLSHKASSRENALGIVFLAVIVVVFAISIAFFLISIVQARGLNALLSVFVAVMTALTIRENVHDTDCVTTFDVGARTVTSVATGWFHATQRTLPFHDVESLNSVPGSIHSRRCVFAVLRAKDGTSLRLGYEREWYQGTRWGGLGNIPKENPIPGIVAEVRAATGLLGSNDTSVMDRRRFRKRT